MLRHSWRILFIVLILSWGGSLYILSDFFAEDKNVYDDILNDATNTANETDLSGFCIRCAIHCVAKHRIAAPTLAGSSLLLFLLLCRPVFNFFWRSKHDEEIGKKQKRIDEITKALEAQASSHKTYSKNLRRVVDSLASFAMTGDARAFESSLDKALATATTAVFGAGGMSEASLWLVSGNEMRIVAHHNVGERTLRNFRLDPKGNGFAPIIAKTKEVWQLTSQDGLLDPKKYVPNPDAKSLPALVTGIPIVYGADGRRGMAVLCFSCVVPEGNPVPQAKNSEIELFSNLVSIFLNMASLVIDKKSNQTLLSLSWNRYVS